MKVPKGPKSRSCTIRMTLKLMIAVLYKKDLMIKKENMTKRGVQASF